MSSTESETRTHILEATWRLMEKRRGQGVQMSEIARAAGVSRQAVYLHFRSRVELLIETTHYVDRMQGLDERISRLCQTTTGVELLDAYVEFWGNYIPGIYGLAKALLATRETDEAAARAWDDRMNAVREGCRSTVESLQRDGMLAPEWPLDTAIDLMWALLSVQQWEYLTRDCGWTNRQYVSRMQTVLKQTFVR